MIAILAGLCTLTGALDLWSLAMDARNIDRQTRIECKTFTERKVVPIEGVIMGPVKDGEGDKMWFVHVQGAAFSVTWTEPKVAGKKS